MEVASDSLRSDFNNSPRVFGPNSLPLKAAPPLSTPDGLPTMRLGWRSIVGVLGAAGLFVIFLVALKEHWLWPGREIRDMLRLPGVVEIQEVRLGSKIGGRVIDVFTAEGAMLSPGEPLIRLDAPELEAQRDQWLARPGSLDLHAGEFQRCCTTDCHGNRPAVDLLIWVRLPDRFDALALSADLARDPDDLDD